MDPRKIVMAAAVVVVAAGCSGPGSRHGRAVAAVPAAAAPPAHTAPPAPPPSATATTVHLPASTSPAAPRAATAPEVTTVPGTGQRSAAAVGCAQNLPSELASTGSARQLITVVAAGWDTSVATIQLWQRSGGCWTSAGGPWTGFIGQNGFADHHIEGDGTTPTGFYGVGPVMYGNQPNPGVREPYHQLVCGDWWDEDPTSAGYNTFQHVPCGQTPPFGGGSEALWKETAPYPSFAVVDYNTGPIVKGAGSAIFLHADTGTPTTGCVSIPLPDLDRTLRWIDPADAPAFVMGPAGEITRF